MSREDFEPKPLLILSLLTVFRTESHDSFFLQSNCAIRLSVTCRLAVRSLAMQQLSGECIIRCALLVRFCPKLIRLIIY